MAALSPQIQAIILAGLAISFDFLNGFHDSSNIVATMIASRAMSARSALALASLATLAAPFLFGVAVAKTVGEGIVDPTVLDSKVIAAALLGAIAWDLITWYFGLPSSSSHALLGGILGSVLIARGPQYIHPSGLLKIVLALFISPPAGMAAGYLLMKTSLFLSQSASPRVNWLFKRLQILTALALALSYGTNDAQKSMGVITMALVTLGIQREFVVPTWVIVACASAISLGVSLGGWRIIKTVGSRIFRVRPIHGFASQTAAASVIFSAALLGGPVSTTQVVSSTIMGVGSAERISSVRWGVAGRIAMTWLVTIPAASCIAALTYLLVRGL